jgi:hypothetical protein
MNAPKHTPLPWRVSDFERRSGGVQRMLMGADDFAVGYIAERAAAENQANAALIVRAVNCHEELLSCLLAYVEIEEDAAPRSMSPLRLRSRAAIAKATQPE